jgi:acetaldehyde dehydrogenase (acetylating)
MRSATRHRNKARFLEEAMKLIDLGPAPLGPTSTDHLLLMPRG